MIVCFICSVVVREVQHYKVGDTITMTLMKKEKGSIYAVPAQYWTKQERKCHNVDGKIIELGVFLAFLFLNRELSGSVVKCSI